MTVAYICTAAFETNRANRARNECAVLTTVCQRVCHFRCKIAFSPSQGFNNTGKRRTKLRISKDEYIRVYNVYYIR